jgi:hypothetical protein
MVVTAGAAERRNRCTKAAVHGLQAEAFEPKNPTVGSFAGCCALAAIGHAAAAPPRRLMNLLRRISAPKLRGQHCIGSNEYFDRAQTGHQNHCRSAQPMSLMGLVSRVTPVHTAVRNSTRDEGRSFEVGNQVLISSHRKPLSSKAMVVNVAEKSEQDFDRHD